MRHLRFTPFFLMLLAGYASPANRPAATDNIPDQPPRLISQVSPVYPLALAMKGEPGVVVVDFTVTANGLVTDVHVVHTTDPGFNATAAAAVAQWRFQPGRKNGRPVNVRMEVPISFNIDSAPESSGPTASPEVADPAPDGGSFDQAPRIILRVPPVYPPELLAAHQSGQVLLTFVVTPEGMVADIRVVHTTDPRFNAAATAAVARWQFFPGLKEGRPVNVRIKLPIDFSLGPMTEK